MKPSPAADPLAVVAPLCQVDPLSIESSTAVSAAAPSFQATPFARIDVSAFTLEPSPGKYRVEAIGHRGAWGYRRQLRAGAVGVLQGTTEALTPE